MQEINIKLILCTEKMTEYCEILNSKRRKSIFWITIFS